MTTDSRSAVKSPFALAGFVVGLLALLLAFYDFIIRRDDGAGNGDMQFLATKRPFLKESMVGMRLCLDTVRRQGMLCGAGVPAKVVYGVAFPEQQ
ncbi:MAG: hypothetical protein AAGI88_16060 [Pseudomonadota bacterium]